MMIIMKIFYIILIIEPANKVRKTSSYYRSTIGLLSKEKSCITETAYEFSKASE